MRVLVADDAQTMAALVVEAVRLAGHEVIAVAPDAQTALGGVRELAPAAVILDGRLTGRVPELVAELIAAAPTVRIFVLVALGELALLRACGLAGAVGGLRRPLAAHEVAAALGR